MGAEMREGCARIALGKQPEHEEAEADAEEEADEEKGRERKMRRRRGRFSTNHRGSGSRKN